MLPRNTSPGVAFPRILEMPASSEGLISIKFHWHRFISLLAVVGLHCCMWAFSSCGEFRLLIVVASLVEHGLHMACGLCSCSSWGSRALAQQFWCRGLVVPQHVGPSRTRDLRGVPCIARWILNHWTTREVWHRFLMTSCHLTSHNNVLYNKVSIRPGQWREFA